MDTNSPFGQAYAQQVGSDPETNPFGDAYKQITGADIQDMPSDVENAKKNVGDSIDQGYCQAFVEKMTGSPRMGGTAAEAWDNYVKAGKANTDVSQAPAGSLIYFQPDSSNGGDGHVGIKDGNGNLISATYNGIESIPLDQWTSTTGQKPLGYVVP